MFTKVSEADVKAKAAHGGRGATPSIFADALKDAPLDQWFKLTDSERSIKTLVNELRKGLPDGITIRTRSDRDDPKHTLYFRLSNTPEDDAESPEEVPADPAPASKSK